MAGVLFFGEVKDGKIKKASREALSIGGKLGAGDVVAIANDKSVAEEAGRYGAKKLYVRRGASPWPHCGARLHG